MYIICFFAIPNATIVWKGDDVCNYFSNGRPPDGTCRKLKISNTSNHLWAGYIDEITKFNFVIDLEMGIEYLRKSRFANMNEHYFDFCAYYTITYQDKLTRETKTL